MDTLNNTRIGGPYATSSAYRFRATTSSILRSVRIYIIGPVGSYGAGTGGTWEITVQTNGAANMPSGVVLAATTFRPTSSGLPLITWSTPATLTAGRLYHIVFRNIDPDPTANYASLDGVNVYQATVPRQPGLSDVDWGQPTRNGTGSWSDRPNTVPIAAMFYDNGATQGLGYMESWISTYESISGLAKVREKIMPASSRTVSRVDIRLMRVSGSSPLRIAVEGTQAACAIPADSIPLGTPGNHSGGGQEAWVGCDLPAVTLDAGKSYNLVLSTASDTEYSTHAIREGSSYNFPSTTYFKEGHAQYTTDGSTWAPFTQSGGGPLDQGDLQFYFR